MPGVPLRRKDHSHMVILLRIRQTLNIPNDSDLCVLIQSLQHQRQPITRNKNIIVEETKKITIGFLRQKVIVLSKALVRLICKSTNLRV